MKDAQPSPEFTQKSGKKPRSCRPQPQDTLGGFLAWIRKERGLTLADLSERTGLSIGTINTTEQNHNDPSDTTLEKLSQQLYFTVENPGDVISQKNKHLPEPNTFGDFLRQLRLDRGLTVESLVEDLPIGRHGYYLIEQNRKLPRKSTLSALMAVLGFTPENPS